MFNAASLIVSVFLAVSSFAAPVPQASVTLPMSVRFNITNGKLPDIDRARAARIFDIWHAKEHSIADGLDQLGLEKRATSLSVMNDAVSYVANVAIGSPASSYSLLIDTGSSNTWVGAGKKYAQTSSSTNTGHSVLVKYGSGSFSGTECTFIFFMILRNLSHTSSCRYGHRLAGSRTCDREAVDRRGFFIAGLPRR